MVGRKLGFWETGASLLHEKAAGAGSLLSMAQVKGSVDRALLLEALMLMHQKHPLLKATLHHAKDHYFFELNAPFDAISFQEIKRQGDDHWLHIAQEQMNIVFPTEKALWRSILLTDGEEYSELIFLFHHAISDGFACVNFIDELLRIYTKLEIESPFEEEPLELLPPVEELLSEHPNVETIEKEVSAISQKSSAILDYQTYKPLGKRITKNLLIHMESDFLEKLTNACHLRKINVNALLYSALMLAQQHLLAKPLDLPITTPINLRGFCKPPIEGDYIGSFVSYITEQLPEINQETHLWDLASTYQKQLLTLIPKMAFLPSTFSANEMSKITPLFDIEKLEERRAFPSALCITNKGHFAFPDIYGSLQLEAYYVTSSCQAGDIMVNLSVTSVLGRMFLCFSYAYPLVNEEYIRDLSNCFVEILTNT